MRLRDYLSFLPIYFFFFLVFVTTAQATTCSSWQDECDPDSTCSSTKCIETDGSTCKYCYGDSPANCKVVVTCGSSNNVGNTCTPSQYSNSQMCHSLYDFVACNSGSQCNGTGGHGCLFCSTALSPPATVTVTATTSSTCGGRINVYWSSVNATDNLDNGYYLYRGTSSSFAPSQTNMIAGPFSYNNRPTSSNPYVDSGRTPGSTYYYKVIASGAGGNSTSSADSAVASAACVSAPSPPSVTAVTGACGGRINVYWSSSSGDVSNGYFLYRGTSSGFTPSSTNLVTSRSTPYTSGSPYVDSGRTPGTTYYYKVIASGDGGNATSGSDSAVASANCANPPSAPSVTAITGSCGNGKINVYWSSSSGDVSNGYYLYRGTSSSFTPSSTNLVTNKSTPYTSGSPYVDQGLTPGNTYYYKVTASGDGGNTTSSADSATASTACVSQGGYQGTYQGTYQSGYQGTYQGLYQSGYQGTYQSGYQGTYQGLYQGSYQGSYQGTYQGAYEGLYQGSYQGSYQGTYQGAYEGLYQGGYQGGYQGTYQGVYQGAYQGSYQGAYQGTYQGAYPPPATYTIQGRVFIDEDQDNTLDSGEETYTPITISSLNTLGQNIGDITYPSPGEYLISGLSAGTYIVQYNTLPPGFSMVYPKGSPPQFQVEVGPTCTVDDTTGASCLQAP
jgi:hypothetical protein